MNKKEILESKQTILDEKAKLESDLKSLDRKLETLKINEEDEIRRKDSVKTKTKLSELTRNDRVFKISYSRNSNINKVTWSGYVDVSHLEFIEKDGKGPAWYKFGVNHKTLPEGFSSGFPSKYGDKHCVLLDFCSNLYFITMNLDTWEEDMEESMKEFIKSRRERFNKENKKFRSNVKVMKKTYKSTLEKYV